MLNLNHLPPYYGPRMQTRMLERSQKYAWRGTSLDIRTYGRCVRVALLGFCPFERFSVYATSPAHELV